MCETPSWRLEPGPLPPTLHKHLYLWSDHRTKGVRWWVSSKLGDTRKINISQSLVQAFKTTTNSLRCFKILVTGTSLCFTTLNILLKEMWGAKAWTLILGLKPYLLIRVRPRRSKCLEKPHRGEPRREMFESTGPRGLSSLDLMNISQVSFCLTWVSL